MVLKNNKSEFSEQKIYMELWKIESALIGLSALFENQKNSADISNDEFFGIGQICKILSQETYSIREKIVNNTRTP